MRSQKKLHNNLINHLDSMLGGKFQVLWAAIRIIHHSRESGLDFLARKAMKIYSQSIFDSFSGSRLAKSGNSAKSERETKVKLNSSGPQS